MKRILIATFLGLSFFVFRVSATEAKSNILLVVADYVGYGDLSCYGNREKWKQWDALSLAKSAALQKPKS